MRCAEIRVVALCAALVATASFAQTTPSPVAGASAPAAAVPPTPLPVVPAPVAAQPLPAERWTPAQVRQAFELADGDHNGELSRGEVQRLAIVPRPFEEMDTNKDGVITRAEFEAAFAR